MFDPKKLLDSFLGQAAGGRAAPQNPGQAGAQPGQSAGFGGGSSGGFLGDIANTLRSPEGVRQGAGKVVDYARQNPLAAGAALFGILGTGLGRGLAGSAIKYGGLAAIASMAYKAYQDHQAGAAPAAAPAQGQAAAQPAAPAAPLPHPAGTDFDPASAPQGEDAFALALLRAMIAAARADGTIDAEESRKIGDKARLSGMEDDAQKFLLEELMKPTSMDAIVAEAKTEAQRIELYTASRLAVDPDQPPERDYLASLAVRLGLPQSLVDHVEATVRSAQVA